MQSLIHLLMTFNHLEQRLSPPFSPSKCSTVFRVDGQYKTGGAVHPALSFSTVKMGVMSVV